MMCQNTGKVQRLATLSEPFAAAFTRVFAFLGR